MMALSVIQHFLEWFGWDHQKFRDHQENMIKFVSKYCRCFRNTFLLLAITIAKSLWSLFILSVYVTTNFALSECKTWRHYWLTWIGTPKHQKRAHWYKVLVSSKLVMDVEQCENTCYPLRRWVDHSSKTTEWETMGMEATSSGADFWLLLSCEKSWKLGLSGIPQ